MRVKEKKKGKFFGKILVTSVFLFVVGTIINIAPNYIQDKLKNRTNLIINNNNVTSSLKHEVIIDEKEIVYISFDDIKNFFDGEIYYDEQYNQIITTSKTKVAAIKIDKKEMYVNSSKVNTYASVMEKEEEYYIPFSEMKNVYNVDIKYSKETDIVTIDSLEKEQKMGNSSKNASVKYKPTTFSKTLDKVKKGESVIVIGEEKGWYKVRTSKRKYRIFKRCSKYI